jgi:hypothetical protein
MTTCETHHHACDCREARFAKIEQDLDAVRLENERLKRENRKLRDDLSWLRSRIPGDGQ